MRRTSIVSGTLFLFAVVGASWADPPDGKKPSLEEDLKRLSGAWRTAEKVKPRLELHVTDVHKDGAAVRASAFYLPMAYQVPVIELKEVGKERVIEHQNPARDLGLTSVPYRFEGDALILKVPDGSLKGEHRLLRVKKFLHGASAVAPVAASEPPLKLQVISPATPIAAGDDVTLEVILSTDGEQSHTFLLGAFPQAFGVYILGPWGMVQPDLTKIRPENWMHQQHSTATKITVAKGKPYRTTLKLSDYFKVADSDVFKPGGYQVNVKFYESGWKMPVPIDSGAVRFELAPSKLADTAGAPRPTELQDVHDLLWILKAGDKSHVDQNLVKRLEKGKVPSAEKARREALSYQLKAGGLLAEEGAKIVGLLRIGVDVPDFGSSRDLIWVVRISHLSRGVTQEMWINSTTGAVRTMLPVQGNPK